MSDLSKKKMSESTKGHKHSEETKNKMSLSAKGKNTWTKGVKFTDEHRKKISEKLKGKQNRLGRKLSDETKNKIRQSNLRTYAERANKNK